MKMVFTFLVALPILLVVGAILSVPASWFVMLLLGAAHSVEPAIPALGFVPTFLLTLAVRIATTQAQPTTKPLKG